MYKLIFIMLMSSITTCQSIEEGWKGIKPLRADKDSVDKKLENPGSDSNGAFYRTDEAFVRVYYSTEPCMESKLGFGDYDVPKNTVLQYSVSLNKLIIKLSDLKFARKNYYRDTSGDVKNSVFYYPADGSIIISVHIDPEGTEYVSGIDYKARKEDAEKFKCADTQAK